VAPLNEVLQKKEGGIELGKGTMGERVQLCRERRVSPQSFTFLAEN